MALSKSGHIVEKWQTHIAPCLQGPEPETVMAKVGWRHGDAGYWVRSDLAYVWARGHNRYVLSQSLSPQPPSLSLQQTTGRLAHGPGVGAGHRARGRQAREG